MAGAGDDEVEASACATKASPGHQEGLLAAHRRPTSKHKLGGGAHRGWGRRGCSRPKVKNSKIRRIPGEISQIKRGLSTTKVGGRRSSKSPSGRATGYRLHRGAPRASTAASDPGVLGACSSSWEVSGSSRVCKRTQGGRAGCLNSRGGARAAAACLGSLLPW